MVLPSVYGRWDNARVVPVPEPTSFDEVLPFVLGVAIAMAAPVVVVAAPESPAAAIIQAAAPSRRKSSCCAFRTHLVRSSLPRCCSCTPLLLLLPILRIPLTSHMRGRRRRRCCICYFRLTLQTQKFVLEKTMPSPASGLLLSLMVE